MSSKTNIFLITTLIFFTLIKITFSQDYKSKIHAISVFGDVKYNKNFKHFNYVNPIAPKTNKPLR